MAEKNDDEARVLQMFAEYRRENIFDRDFRDIHDPIYSTFSERLKISENEIRKIILRIQPSLILPKCR